MALLDPKLSILDETDSGLDIDALKTVAAGVNACRSDDNAIILITHYQRLLDYIKPDYVHVMSNGKIVRSGGKEYARARERRVRVLGRGCREAGVRAERVELSGRFRESPKHVSRVAARGADAEHDRAGRRRRPDHAVPPVRRKARGPRRRSPAPTPARETFPRRCARSSPPSSPSAGDQGAAAEPRSAPALRCAPRGSAAARCARASSSGSSAGRRRRACPRRDGEQTAAARPQARGNHVEQRAVGVDDHPAVLVAARRARGPPPPPALPIPRKSRLESAPRRRARGSDDAADVTPPPSRYARARGL